MALKQRQNEDGVSSCPDCGSFDICRKCDLSVWLTVMCCDVGAHSFHSKIPQLTDSQKRLFP